jgi:hypothetical protein
MRLNAAYAIFSDRLKQVIWRVEERVAEERNKAGQRVLVSLGQRVRFCHVS